MLLRASKIRYNHTAPSLRGFLPGKPATSSADNEITDASSTSSDKRQQFIREYFDNVYSDKVLADFERLLIQFQADNGSLPKFAQAVFVCEHMTRTDAGANDA